MREPGQEACFSEVFSPKSGAPGEVDPGLGSPAVTRTAHASMHLLSFFCEVARAHD